MRPSTISRNISAQSDKTRLFIAFLIVKKWEKMRKRKEKKELLDVVWVNLFSVVLRCYRADCLCFDVPDLKSSWKRRITKGKWRERGRKLDKEGEEDDKNVMHEERTVCTQRSREVYRNEANKSQDRCVEVFEKERRPLSTFSHFDAKEPTS